MIFNDEYVADLKEAVKGIENGLPVFTVTMGAIALEALLHRLECAEKALLSRTLIDQEADYDAWLQSKGAARE